MKLIPVEDTALLDQLNAAPAPNLTPVDDPALLRLLDGEGYSTSKGAGPRQPPAGVSEKGLPQYSADNPPYADDAFVGDRATVNGVEYRRHQTTGAIVDPTGKPIDDPLVLQAFGKTKPTKAAQRSIDATRPGAMDYVSEFGKAVPRGAAQTVESMAKGLGTLTSDIPDEIAKTEEGIANLKSMTPEQATEFMRSLPGRLSPAVAFNYQTAIRKIYEGKDAEALPYLEAARRYTDTRPVSEQGLTKAAEGLTSATGQQFPEDPRFKGSLTTELGQAAGSTLAFLPLGILSGGTGVMAGGGLASANEAYETAQRDIATSRRDDRAGLYNAGLGTEAEIKARQAAKMGIAPGLSEAVPIETFLEQAPRIIPGLRPLAGSPAWKRFGQAFGRIGTQVLTEGGQEAFQAWAQNVINQITLDPEQVLSEDVLRNAAIGAAVGGGMQTTVEVGGAITGRNRAPDPAAPPQTPPAAGQQPPQPQTVAPGKGNRIEPRLFPQAGRPTEITVTPAQPDTASAPVPGRAPWAPGAGPIDPVAAPPLREASNAEIRAIEGEASRQKPVRTVQTEADLEAARLRVNTAPSEAQAKAGNYAKAHLKVQGLDIAIENPKGSTRKGTDPDGKAWESPPMPGDYGYIKGATAKDGDKLDVLIGPDPASQTVFVIDQNDLTTGRYDEAKTVVGARSADEAVALYSGGFSDGRAEDRIGAVTQLTMDEFKAWVKSGNTRKPIGKKYAPSAPAKAGTAPQAPRLRPASAAEVKAIEAAPAPFQATPEQSKAFDAYMGSKEAISEDALAAKLGGDRKAAGRMIADAIQKRRIMQTKTGKLLRMPSRVKPLNVLEFIASVGGIKDSRGEMKARDITSKTMTPYGPVVRPTGLGEDEILQRLLESRYIRDPGRGTGQQLQKTFDDVLALIDNDKKGGKSVYSEDDVERVAEIEVKARNKAAEDMRDPDAREAPEVYAPVLARKYGPDIEAEVVAAAKLMAIDITRAELDMAGQFMMNGMSAENAVEAAVIRSEDAMLDEAEMWPDVQNWIRQKDPDAVAVFVERRPSPFDEEDATVAQEEESDAEPGRTQETGAAPEIAGEEDQRPEPEEETDPGREQEAGAGETGGSQAVATEPGADNKPQTVIPGAEQDVKGAVKNAAKKPLKGTKPQKDMDVGMFGDAPNSPELFDAPQKKPEEKPKPKAEKWTKIGTNKRGNPVFEDENGVRSYTESGIRMTEPVGIIPGGGISVGIDRSSDFEPAAEQAPAPKTEAKPEPIKINRQWDYPVSQIAAMSGPDMAPFARELAILRAWTGSLSDAEYRVLTEHAAYDFPRIMGVTQEPARLLAAWKQTLRIKSDVTLPPGDYSKVLNETEAELLAPKAATKTEQASGKPNSVKDDSNSVSKKPAEKPNNATSQTEQAAKPADYGTKNTLVSADRAAELRAKLKAKLKNQISAGIDPEMLAMGAELAAFHIEAGARKFVDFARAIASDLDVSVKTIRPYLRSWYNGARDMMEDAGIDIAGMDSPDDVKAALATIDQEESDGTGTRVRKATPGIPAADEPGNVPPTADGGTDGGAREDDREAGGGNVREPDNADADVEGTPDRVPSKGGGARGNSGNRGRNRNGGDRSTAQSADVAKELRDLEKDRAERRLFNYQITEEDQIGQGGPKDKVARNIAAIRTIKTILEEKRAATPEEKKVLVRYVGWGAFAQDVFAKHKPEWQKERAALADLLTAEEFASARASTLNAHYTSEDVITGMWRAMEHLGFKGGRALEPSSGVGHFIGLTPKNLRSDTDWSAVELDTITGNIAKHLYAGADVNVMGFEKFNRPPGFYDLAISNVPFGDFRITDPKRPGYLIHDYFFVKGLDLVRPGGLVAFITSSGTMDKQDQTARKEIAKRADFVGAIRLPGGKKGAFAGNAGTEVTTDIIFLRKRGPGMAALPDAAAWLDLKTIKTPEGDTQINEYFAGKPEMMLGEMRLMGTMYRAASPVLVGDSENLGARVAEAAAKMPGNIMLERSTAPKVKETATVAAEGGKEGGYFQKNGKLYRRVEGVGVPQNLAATDAEKITSLVGIRDIVNELLANQAKGKSEKNDDLRAKLNKAYDAFVRKHGPINLENTTVTNRVSKSGDFVIITKRPNFSKFSLDPDAFKVAAIENYNPDTKTASKAAIFTADILGPAPAPSIASSADTIGWSLNMHGRLSLPDMASLAGKTEAQLIRDLGDLIYENPGPSDWEPRDQYLSGDVVTKLEEARGAAESDPKFKRNVDALEKVQPAPLTRDDVRVPFGAPWVPADVYGAFARDELDSDLTLTLNPVTKRWGIKASRFSRTAETKYATPRMRIDEIIKHALDQTPARVMDKDANGNLIFNPTESEQAQVRVNALREAFAGSADGAVPGWIWNDDERAIRLEAIYNARFNRLVPQVFDGSHLTLPGLTATITDSAGQKVPFALRPHQKNAVARVIQNGNTLLAHVVGAGKTFTMIAAGMEQRRLGQKQRPMFVVPNHMLEQFSREFLQAYPGANILVAQKDEMTRDNRKAFAAKIAAQKWDGIIITHDAFGRLRMSQEAYQEFTEAEIEQVTRAKIAAAEEEGKKSPTVKDLEKLIKRLETKLANLIKEDRKDEGVIFEELGVDQIYLDEAHLFKNLAFYTRHTRIKGIGGTASQRSTDLFMKIRHLEKSYPGRSTVFATGTPVSNTMAEMYTMQRYLQLETINEYGVGEFDAWAATFGEVRSQMELGPDGRTLRETTSFSRFINIPELYAMYSRVADAQTADMLNLPRPKRKGGKIEIIESEFSEREELAALGIVQRALELKGKKAEKGSDNMLKVVGDGRKLATDARLLNPAMPYNPKGKIAQAIGRIYDIWKEGEYPAIAQAVFLDMGVPQSKAAAKPQPAPDEDFSEDADDDAETVLASRFDLYADIRDRLVARGIPKEQIAFIHDANDDLKKARLFGKVRSGEVRVLIGSTGKMGVGTNVQRLLTALHHLDAPWKPAEVEQRDGRIERQGNLNSEISIIRYVTKKSMDAFMWQTLERKAQFIGQLLAGARGIRHAEDIDSPLPEASDMKAAATGDPRIMEQAELTKNERQLKVAQSSHNRVITEAKRGVASTEARITYLEGQSAAMARDAAKVKPTAGDQFKIDIELRGRITPVAERKQAGEMLRRFGLDTGRTVWGPARGYDIGTISGMPVQMHLKQSDDGIEYAFTVSGEASYGEPVFNILTEEADAVGLVRRIENALADVPRMANYTADELARAKTTLTKMKAAATEKPFPRQKELDEVSGRLKALNDEFKKESEKKPEASPPADQAPLSSRLSDIPRANPYRASISQKQRRAVDFAIQQDAQRILGHSMGRVVTALDLSVYGFDANEEAVYDPNSDMIYVAMQASGNPRSLARHEMIHKLRNAGVFTRQEWAVLSRMAQSRWISQYDIRARYERLYRERFDITADQVEELLIEEAIAEAFADHWLNPSASEDLITRIFERIKRFLEAVANAARGQGYQTAEDVLGATERGDVGRRAPGSGQKRGFLLYARQDAIGRDITKTEAFKRWFGNSKVVDENGEPMVMYHGTDKNFSKFKTRQQPRGFGFFVGAPPEVGSWFGSSPKIADVFTREPGTEMFIMKEDPLTRGVRDGGNIMPVYVSLQNPIIFATYSDFVDASRPYQTGKGMRNALERKGYDGILIRSAETDRGGERTDVVAFNPTQIKSAVGNSGAFSPYNPSILSARPRLTPPRNPAAGSFDAPHDERVRKALFDHTDTLLNRIRRAGRGFGVEFRRQMQDREVDLLRTQKAIGAASGPVTETQDAYMAASLYPGRVAQRDKDLVQDVIEPLVKEIADRGLTLEQVDEFNRARHAFERNIEIGQLYKPGQPFHDAMFDPNIVGGSGMSDNEAAAILDAFQNNGKYADLEAVGDKIVAMNRRTLTSLFTEGLIDQDTFDTLTQKYRFYVPLRGFEEATDDSHPDSPKTGSRYDVRGKEFQNAFGRSSKSDSPLAYSILQARQAIIRIEKNRVGKRFLRLAQANPNEAFWQVNRVDLKKVIDKNTGLVRNVYDRGATQAENVYAVKVGGKTYHVTLHHDGLLRAMKGIGGENMHGAIVVFHKINRFLAAMNTSYDPEFIFRNFFRDLQQTGIVLSEERIPGLKRAVIGNIAKATRGMNAMLKGDLSSQWAQHARDYADAGGKMGFMDRNDIESEKRQLDKLFSDANPTKGRALGMAIWKHTVERLDRYNDAIENTLRLSTYVALRNAGVSRDKAALAARELTVNFNRKGELGPLVNSLYMFFNASMQGIANMSTRLVRSPRLRKVAAGIIAAAFLQDMLNRMIAGDDDDDRNRYDKIDAEIKARNGIIMMPKWFEEKYGVPYFSWPLPLGYNSFHVIGTQVGHAVAGAESPMGAAANIVGAIADAFNPLGNGGTLSNFFAPTLLDPVVDINTNTNWFGEDIVPRQFDETTPYAERYRPNVDPLARGLTDALAKATGGSPERAGSIDISPEWVEHLWEFATGGVGRMFSRLSSTRYSLMNDEDVDVTKVPFARIFVGRDAKFADRDNYFEIKDAVHVTEKEYKARLAEGDRAAADRVKEKHGRELQMVKIMDEAEKRLAKLRKQRKIVIRAQSMGEAARKQRLDKINAAMDEIQLAVRRRWNQLEAQ